ncbi:hypothetical protein SSABA_v1c02280 [Spiroplasma sabaudiense Ar-1343]|uniref:Uncharacterized protein n=1 Tax=Spiroplasma sabaudiense Ar-1343 TaxID=1276257 RepID=W6A9U2_9MOLU|nr:hypothetical protein [Spiroplasma sabaudiense]AHI53640.1 hypothetical protein SSABA_v1c02280 [Spiroplasma sabaudiense Ar-1343]
MLKLRNPEIAKIFDNHHFLDEDCQIDNRVAVDFWKYLADQKISLEIDISQYLELLEMSAKLNKRNKIIQGDLFILKEPLLFGESLVNQLVEAISKTMFFALDQQLSENAEYKDFLIENLENKDVCQKNHLKLIEILKWLDNEIIVNQDLLKGIPSNYQISNYILQADINSSVTSWVSERIAILKFQKLTFTMIYESHKKILVISTD